MMSDQELETYFDKLDIPLAGRHYVQRQRSGPSRRVQSDGTNVVGRYPSRMGHTIQFESRTVELPIIHMLEDNEDVLEYFDQPEQILLKYRGTKD